MTTKRRRTLPPVSPKVSAELRPLVSAIAEIIETGEGVRGNPLDRKLTLRDLLDSGIGRLRNGLPPSNPGALQPGTGAPDLSTPPKPVGFEAVAAFDGEVFLTWETPQRLYSNHALTNIYRAESDNFANAERIGQEPGMFYIDNVRADASQKTYYYWISFTSTSDVEGPVNDTAGTPVTTILSPEYIIDKINGLISKSELANDVLTPINQIPSINTTLADHAGRIQSTEAALSDLLNVPAYDTGTDYAVDDLVSYNGFTWRALVAMTAPAPTPTEGANWTQVGQYATFGDIIAGNAVAIDDLDVRVTSAEGSITSYGTEITGIKTRLTNTENGTTANSTAINTLDSRVTQTEQGISANSSDITQLQNDLSTAENGITANSQALSLLDSRVGSAEGTITSQGQAVTQLQSDLNNLASTASANASAINSLTTRVTSAEGSLSSVAQDVSQLQVSVGDNSAAIQTKAEVSAVQGIANDVAVLSAQYTVKLDVNGRVAGIGLANNNGVTSFVVASDSVYFIDPGQSITAFNPDTNYASMAALRNTQFVFGYATVEGQRRFAINVPAYIPDATITNAMIKNAVITGAKIKDATINGAKIDIADIWELNIADVIRSTNYLAGERGWRVTKSGSAEFSDVTVRGHVEMETGYISDQVQIGGVPQYSNFRPGNFLRNGAGVSASSPVSNLNYLTDGVRSISGDYWELDSGSGPQYLQADIGFETFVSESRMFFYALDGRRYRTAVSVSRDGVTWEYVLGSGPANGGPATAFVWSRSPTGGYLSGYEFPTIVPVGKFARYVRVWINGNSVNTGNHGYEWELYGAGGGGEDPYTASIGSTTEDWVRPGTTLIDGNKIFTGDAYVDTLQIKGNAITLLQAQTDGSRSGITNWVDVISFTYYTGTTGNIAALVTWGGELQGGTAGESDGDGFLRLVVAGVVRGSGSRQGTRYRTVGASTKLSFPNTGVSIKVQYKGDAGSSACRKVFATVLGVKR